MATKYQHGKVSEEAVAALRAKIGQEMRISTRPYLTEATHDAIRHWAEGIGDRNPLYADPEYGKRTRWGTHVAPPTILYAFDRQAIGYRGGLPGVHSMFGGTDWSWLHPIRHGDRITAKVVFKDLIERQSKFAGRHFQQMSDVTWTNQDGVVVARSVAWGFRTERGEASERGKYKRLESAAYTREDLERISSEYEKEEIRGATPRYWEEVKAGDELPSIVRGPYTITNVIAFEQAWGGLFVHAHGYWYDILRRHPKMGILNQYGVPEPPEAVHWDHELAKSVGVPAAYDYGPERIAWMGSLVTNWMGDNAILRRLHVQVRRFNLVGDTTWCRGTVAGTRQEEGEHLVDIDVRAEDQRGELTAKGEATVALLSRREAP